MHAFIILLMVLALLAVLVTLALGVVGLFRGATPRRSNKLMQYRVVFQAVAILIFVIFMLLYRST